MTLLTAVLLFALVSDLLYHGRGYWARFDRAFFGHIGFISQNVVRALLLGLTNGRIMHRPVSGRMRHVFGQFTRMSAAFAVVSEAAMVTLGGQLKRREKISGRLADVLAWMYLGSATLKRYVDDGQPERDLPLVRWASAHALHQAQTALLRILDNLPSRVAAWVLRPLVFPLGARLRPPDDTLGAEVARELLEDRAGRLHLTADIYVPPAQEKGLGRLEAALEKAVAALAVETKIRDAVRAGLLDKAPGELLLDQAGEAGIVTEEERRRIHDADEARDEAIRVDAFDPETFRSLRG